MFLVRPGHEAAVFEMGINRPGEMDELAAVYEPDCALITNVGTAHVGVLGGTRAAIAEQKKRIASRFDGGQTLVVWEDDDFRDALMTGVRGRCETYGPRSTDGFEGARDLGLDGCCETDFVANTPDFQELLKDIGMHIAASKTRS